MFIFCYFIVNLGEIWSELIVVLFKSFVLDFVYGCDELVYKGLVFFVRTIRKVG